MQHEHDRIVDALPGLVWTAGPDGNIDFVNQRWCDYTGQGADDVCGCGWHVAVHPDDLPDLRERWRLMLARNEASEIEVRLRRSDGKYRWFLLRAYPSIDAASGALRWCGIGTDIEERKQSERVTRAREHRFRSIVDGLPALVTLASPGGEVVLANRQVLEYFGATPDELQGLGIEYGVHPDDCALVLARWRDSDATGRPLDYEARLRRADGSYRWFHMLGYPLEGEPGRVELWYLVQTDVEERRYADTLLAGEKRLLEMVVTGQSASDILEELCRIAERITAGCYCSVVLVDPTGTRLEHGAAPSLPASFISAINGRPVNTESGPCAMAAYLNEQVISPDLTAETRWASYQWCPMAIAHGLQACWSTPILSSTGDVLGAFAIYYAEPKMPTPFHLRFIEQFTHIASIAIERAQSDEALRRSDALLAEAQRLTATGTFCWQIATGEISWSNETYRIFGFDPSVPVTLERIATRMHPEDVPPMQEFIDRARTASGDLEFEHRLLMPDLSVKHLHLVANRTLNQDGQPQLVGWVQDVTQRRLADEALGKARSELAHMARVTSLGVLTASIAHEVNQPLAGIITNASACLRMLAVDPPDISAARETARRMIRDSNRASDVVTRLRALFSKSQPTAGPVDLNDAVREVIALSRGEMQRARVIVRLELAEALPPVIGDRIQLQQVILNLLLNASDAMSGIEDRPRQVVVRTEPEDGGRVRLAVRDSGVGVEPQATDKLFDPFYTTKAGGMGIGLSVSRSIIENHGGRLWAESNYGVGTTFVFSIPREPDAADPPGPAWPSPDARGSQAGAPA